MIDLIEREFKNFNIQIFDNKSKLIIYSNDNYSQNEISKLFTPYKNDDCIKNIYDNLKNTPRERFFYIEEIKNNIINKRNGVLTYVMLNPSYARAEQSDPTMDRARKYAGQIYKNCNNEKIGYKYFAVINIYAFRHHIPSVMKKVMKEKKDFNTNNFDFIKALVDKNKDKNKDIQLTDFILAYGDEPHKNDIKKIKNILEQYNKKTYFCKLSHNGNPYHLLARKKKKFKQGEVVLFDSLMPVSSDNIIKV